MRVSGTADVVTMLQALAEPTRWRTVVLLSAAPRRAGELAAVLRVTAPTMSKHLRMLLEAGLVVDERPLADARARVFRLRQDALDALRARLDQLEASDTTGDRHPGA
jgi:DNA-binding transcriptional ArsR family regulator